MNLKPLAQAALAVALVSLSLQARAVGQITDVTIIDRDSGTTLPLHYHRGEYWVAGKPGARYAVALRNRSGARILAVTSVDGVNVISGDTASWSQTGYVISGRERYEVTGWRKNDSEVAAFEFSDARDAYATRTGRPADTGVIGVAVFRERMNVHVAVPSPPVRREPPSNPNRPWPADAEGPSPSSRAAGPGNSVTRQRLGEQADARASASPPPLPVSAPSPAPSVSPSGGSSSMQAQSEPVAPAISKAAPVVRLGTAHGARESAPISSTTFERRQSQPDEIIRIRYDSRDNLIASGVIPAVTPTVPNAFPGTPTAYVPDPPPLAPVRLY